MRRRGTTPWVSVAALCSAALVGGALATLGAPGALADPPARDAGAASTSGSARDAGAASARSSEATDAGAVTATAPSAPGDAGSEAPLRCREQRAQPELIRANYVAAGSTPEETRERRRMRHAALRIRTERYGFFEGFGERAWNPHPPMHYAESTTFFGIPVRLNRRVIPAVRCAEQEIRRSCSQFRYRPSRLAGIRPNNSFGGGEISNHVFGIALDIDPDRNPCCGCGGRFAEHPGCTRSARTIFDRMQMPECWIRAFERHGFYWLGNDREIRDTMHFEFLGDPDRITE